jgi:hypothetical protein
VYSECESVDVNRYGFIPLASFELILTTTLDNKLTKEDIEVIRKLSVDRFLKKDSTDFLYGEKDSCDMPLFIDNIITYRAEIITQGLIENDRNKLESYLMTYFSEADTDKTGFLTEAQLLEALQKCPRMSLIDLEVSIEGQLRTSLSVNWLQRMQKAGLTTNNTASTS